MKLTRWIAPVVISLVSFVGAGVSAHADQSITIHPDTGEAIVLSGEGFVIDPATGQVVGGGGLVGTQAITVTRGNCPTNAACWTSPAAIGDFGFTGLGTATGNWPSRQTLYSGNANAKFCYIYQGGTICPAFTLAPNSSANFAGGAYVTGTKITRS